MLSPVSGDHTRNLSILPWPGRPHRFHARVMLVPSSLKVSEALRVA
jgi:hypothetical protein